MKEKTRILWIDIYKGILIFLMVFAHTKNGFIPYIYCFHMAAFFFISGYSSNYDKDNFVDYFKKKAKSLLIPFFVINICFIILFLVMNTFGIYGYFSNTTVSINSLIEFLKYFWSPDIGGATWFLIVLFLSSICSKLLHDLISKKTDDSRQVDKIKLTTASIILIIFYYLFYNKGEFLPYYLDLIPMALFFITAGNFIARNKKEYSKSFKVIMFLLAIIFYFWFVKFNYFHIEWTTRHFPNIIIMLLASFSGICLLTCLSKVIEKIKNKFKIKLNLIEFLGKNTLAILLYHFLGFRIFYVILFMLKQVPASQLKLLTPAYSGFIINLLTAIFAIIFALVLDKLIKFITMKIKTKKLFENKIINCFFIAILIFCFSKWVFNAKNYFIFDDWNNLATLPFKKFSEISQILPTDVYCSRPVGWIVVKFILLIFGLNYQGHALSMLLIHIINAILLYFIARKLLKNNPKGNIISLISTLIFSLYPISTFASFWEAGMFDLFGCTLTLICILIFLHIDNLSDEKSKSAKKIILSFLLIIVYYISLRTKEMFIGLPVALIIYSYFQSLDKKENNLIKRIKNTNIKKFLRKNIYLIIMMIVMLAYFGFTRILNTSSTITHDINDAYYYSFNPIILIKNLFTYIYVYFNPNSLVYGNVTDIIKYSTNYKMAILVLIIIFVIYAIRKFLNKDDKPLVFVVFFLILILPVLPMKNMHHVLYLYVPSVFISLFIAYFTIDILKSVIKHNETYILATLIVLILVNSYSGVKNFRNYWINVANRDKKTYQYFVNIKKEYKDIDNVYIINVPKGEYTSFYNGPGYVVNVAYNNPKIKIYINDKGYNLNDKKSLIIDFNNYKFKILNNK